MTSDLELLALDGALGGITVGSLFELGEAYLSHVEPPIEFLAEIAAVALAGAVLCVAVSAMLKRLQPRS